MKNKGTAVILTSGGIDSAACIHLMLSQGISCEALFVDYGQKALSMERKHSELISKHYKIPYKAIKVTTNNLNDFGTGEIFGRNLFLISTALMFSNRPNLIVTGIHSGTNYYDCSNAFFHQSKLLIENLSDGRTSLSAPFIDMTKDEILCHGFHNNIPFNKTFSCETDSQVHCGKCLSCLDREGLNASQKENSLL